MGISNIAADVDSCFEIENRIVDSTNVIMNLNPYGSFYLSDDDLLLAAYDVLEDNNRWIQLDRYDATRGEIAGRFEISYIPDPFWIGLPQDTLTFSDGSFSGRIVE